MEREVFFLIDYRRGFRAQVSVMDEKSVA